jgi:hypothetical protein
MVNRRGVLKIGATTMAGALVNLPGLGRNVAPAPAHSSFQRAVFDQRFAECRAFAAELNSAGVVTSAIRGDVAKLWYQDLRAHLSKNPAPIAGLTDRAALFCLEELARDVDMRVIFRADHITEQNERTQHAPVGLAQEPGFGRTMARLLSRFDINGPRDMTAQKRTGPFSPENKTALVSWVIA